MNAFDGNSVNILIITDRLMDAALPLCDFLDFYDDIKCSLINSADDFDPDTNGIPDILISAGYLEKRSNWDIIKKCRSFNPGVFCILWGIVDSCIKEFYDQYEFNEYFDRSLPFETFLKHLKEWQSADRRKYSFFEKYLGANLSYQNNDYIVSAYSNNIIELRDLGICPVSKRPDRFDRICYTSNFCIKSDKLFLKDLSIKSHSAYMPAINNSIPSSKNYIKEGHTYHNIYLPLSYTGNIILAKGKRDLIKEEPSPLVNQLFGWKQIVLMSLKNGKIIRYKPLKKLLRHIHLLSFFLPFWEHIKTADKFRTHLRIDCNPHIYSIYV